MKEVRVGPWRAGAARRATLCRQTCDALIREVTREAAAGVAAEVEAAHAAAARVVARAVASAVIDRLEARPHPVLP